ncbi:MAG: hypothetical protein ACI4RM_00950 [Ruminococcus sp.]
MKKKSGHNRRFTSKNSILLLVMLVCIFLSTWAWFASGQMDASASGLSANTQAPATLQMALPDENDNAPEDDSEYSSSINFNEQIDVIRTMMSDVTSDGLYFINPTTTQSDGVRVVVEDAEWNRATANEDYVSIPFYVRSENPNIYLNKNSRLITNLRDKDGTTILNESDVKGISRNAIVGAMRISIVDITKSLHTDKFQNFKPDTTDLKLTWIPRPDLLLNTPTDAPWTLTENVLYKEPQNEEQNLITLNPTYVHSYYAIKGNETQKETSYYDTGSGTGVVLNTNTNAVSSVVTEGVTPTLGQDVQIGDGKLTSEIPLTTTTMNGKEYYLYKFVMNIWVEGEDAEARRALNNGEFDLDLKFSAGTTES